MKMKRRMVGGRLVAAAFGTLAVAAFGPAVQPVAAQTPAAAVYEREVFTYPAGGRRDPFRPLNAGERIGPRFEDLSVSGVLFNPAIGSVATLTDQKTGRRYRVREGDVIGEVRVTAIRLDEVDFLITSFGISRGETLKVKTDKENEG